MLWVPQKGRLRVQHNTGTVGASPYGTAVTTGAAASTKGTAVELIASTNFDAYWVCVITNAYGASATASRGLVDILIGTATEEILIPDLMMGNCGGATGDSPAKTWMFPLYVPAGARIAAQAAGDRVSTAMRVSVYLYGGHGTPPFRVGSKVTTYGIGTVPAGTAITPGASGAEGSWTEITSSTTSDHFALCPSLQINDSTQATRIYAADLGVGAATEEEVAAQYWYHADSAETLGGPFNPMPTFVDIPSATRLVMRVSNSGTNDAAYEAAIHAVS